ncbi:MAG: hypothetical protein A3H96_25090 [Acidobacteria bacterium RIFCSPLOWO2_02_FULL_67_36]|nr:MAG: hypothetical protein A3H96_25090 [Acidobacteria bacterium RIFCSPLOWO2_02_FULL_67_36]OFW20612.1 MAG: hypothetical protein A3G21_22085 [Acidobacteria bacterium RIFCSPLOWO2_12_FULL_66_21]
MPEPKPTQENSESGGATSFELLKLARAGDREALEELFARHFPPLRRWTRGRLPRWARSIAETADLVQDVMLNTFRRLDAIEVKRKGALQAYLRQSIHNRIRDELRTFGRRAPQDPLDSAAPSAGPSPFDAAVDAETRERYAAALAALAPREQELLVGYLELGYNYEQLALATGRRSADAARVALRRAMLALADEMTRG